MFGGVTDGDLDKTNDNTITTQKWVNLLSLMLDSFKNNGHCVTMDSAYMGNIMVMIGHNVWRINMVGTAQANRTGANVDCTKSMKKGTYGAVCWQHTWQSLCFAVWSDNALVRTLSNFHGPMILEAGRGVLQKKRGNNGKQERMKTEVPCPAQMRDYCKTFHLINEGNGAEANYDLGGKSRLHNWLPKLIFWLYNMALNNAYKMYKALVKQHMPERRFLDMGDAMRKLMHNLCQRGPVMRKLRAEHPSWMRDMSKLFGWITGRKVCADAKGMMTVQSVMLREEPPTDTYALLKNQQQQLPWRVPQSKAVTNKGRCYWDDCPGIQLSKAKCLRSSKTHMRCVECGAYLGTDLFLCNGFAKGGLVNCHRQYHMYHHNKEFASTMVIN